MRSCGLLVFPAPGQTIVTTLCGCQKICYLSNFGCTIKNMEIEYDPIKRQQTLQMRQLDFIRAPEVFARIHFTAQDTRKNYGEIRNITVGMLDNKLVVLVWTQRGAIRRIISMRKANEREKERFSQYMD